MEINGYSHFEQSYLINELSQGMELARQLRDQMGPEHSIQTKEMLLEQIVSSYDKALFILGCGASSEQQPHQLMPVQSPVMPSSPSSIVESPNGNDLNTRSNCHHEGSLKRKSASTWTKQMKLNPENGLDGPPNDGYSWRKYGQKDILGAKHPRSYYRCTYRNTQECWATRQVQRSENDETVFDITYKGKHTCTMVRRSKSAPTSPGNQQEPKHEDSAMGLSFDTVPLPNNADMHNMDSFPPMSLVSLKSENPTFSTSTLNNNNLYGNLSTSLISPSTPSSNYFSMEADLADMILAATSSTNSSSINPDFTLDSWNINPNFSFNDPGFFSEQKGSF